jgi:hypothetical protein
VSVAQRRAGVSGGRVERERKAARVAAMTAPAAAAPAPAAAAPARPVEATAEPVTASITMRDQFGRVSEQMASTETGEGREFDPRLDLIAPAIGVVGLVFAGVAAAHAHPGPRAAVAVLSVARVLVGALFLGAVSDAMLLGHWYLTQPGLSRRPIGELNDWLLRLCPVEVALFLIPTGMISVLNGTINDTWGGVLGWMWVVCALTTMILAYVTRVVLRERYYSAVMAATGLLYLAILTAFGTDIVARAVLQG